MVNFWKIIAIAVYHHGHSVLTSKYYRTTEILTPLSIRTLGLRISTDTTACNINNMLEIVGNMTLTGNINNMPISYLDASSSIQGQFNNFYNSTLSPILSSMSCLNATIGYNSNPWVLSTQSSGFYFVLSNSSKAMIDNNGAYHTYSDRRLKKDIININSSLSLDIIKTLNAYEYNYIDNDNKKSIGFMAQDVLLINALAVDTSQEMMSINYNNLFIHNINATKKLISRVDIIETFINANMNGNIPITTTINPLDDINLRLSQLEATIIEQAKLINKLKKLINN